MLWRRRVFLHHHRINISISRHGREGSWQASPPPHREEPSLPTRRTKALLDAGPKEDERWCELPGLLRRQQPESPGFSICGHRQEAGGRPHFPPLPPKAGLERCMQAPMLGGPNSASRERWTCGNWPERSETRSMPRRPRFSFLKCRSDHGIPRLRALP